MDFVLLILLAIAQWISSDATVSSKREDVCLNVSCNKTTPICRIAQMCAGPNCPLQARCLTCLPKAIENVCINKGFLYAVLVDSSQPSGIIERKCLLHQANDEPNCPKGTICVPDDKGFGTCCYGKLHPRLGLVPEKKPKTCPRIPNRCGHCKQDRNVCKDLPIFCLIPPCPEPTYKCVPIQRKGECPTPKKNCERTFHRCFYDYECSGSLKCCPDDCRIRSCVAAELGCADLK